MKFNLKLMSLSLAALSLAACSDDLDTNGVGNGDSTNQPTGKVVYFSAGLSLPTSGNYSRSATDSIGDTNSDGQYNHEGDGPDMEVGHEYENEVNNVILVFTNDDYKYLTHAVIPSVNQAPVKGQKYDFTIDAELNYDDLEKAYEGGLLGQSASQYQIVHVFAFCNYTSRMFERFKELNTTALDHADRTNWIDWEGLVEEDPSPAWETPSVANTIWSKNSFTMTNASIDNYVFPKTLDDWDPYTDRNNPYFVNNTGIQEGSGRILTPIKVERVAARLDYKDGSPSTTDPSVYPIEVYTTYPTTENPKGVTANYYSVKLSRMSLVNMNKHYYYLRRVSDDGTATGAKVGGVETPANYVVDYNWEPKSKGVKDNAFITPETAPNYFNFPLYNTDNSYARTQWFSTDIADILSNKYDGDTWTNGTDGGSYKIWRYVTENTIPGVDQQMTIQSTGIIFKGAIIAGDSLKNSNDVSAEVKAALAEAEKRDADSAKLPVLYSYENILYASVPEMIAAALDEKKGGPNSPLYNKVWRVLRHWKLNGNKYTYDSAAYKNNDPKALTVEAANTILNLPEDQKPAEAKNITIDFKLPADSDKDYKGLEYSQFMANCAAQEITVYRASNEYDTDGWGYYCYYFYWNRHNDNDKSGKMGHMEFATVRNNVYKLMVTTVSKLGHPRDTDLDPDPVDPNDPDEDIAAYIRVQVEVLPWVVRLNNITF